jgi:cyclic pyranopterin monophosphate synthase
MKLTHVDNSGRARMVDVSAKRVMRRSAAASGRVQLSAKTVKLIRANEIQKGDVLAAARLAAVAGAKRTAELVPLCHNIPIDHVAIDFVLERSAVTITASTSGDAKTGIEMEALTAVAIAALTIFDMCKAVDKHMVISDIHVVEKKKSEIPD